LSKRSFQVQPSTALLTAGGRTVLAVGVTCGRTEGFFVLFLFVFHPSSYLVRFALLQ